MKGVLTRHPDWAGQLAGLYAEAAGMMGDWDAVKNVLQQSNESTTPELIIASALLAFRTRDYSVVTQAISQARLALGAPLTSGGRQSYKHLYGSIINLNLIHELQMVHSAELAIKAKPENAMQLIERLNSNLATRLESTQPSFTAREPILSMRRTAFGLW